MLQALGALATFSGALILIAGAIFMLIVTFKESVLWGVACLLFGPASLAFLILHWDVAKRPFFWQLWGIALILIGCFGLGYHNHLH